MQTLNQFLNYCKDLLAKHYPEEKVNDLIKLQGFDESKLDITDYFDVLMQKGLKEATIDPNANLTNYLNVPKLYNELFKPQKKLLSYFNLYNKMKEMYGEDEADECLANLLDYTLYLHDSTNVNTYYCASIETINIVMNGRQWNKAKSDPPKHPTSFLGQVVESILNFSLENTGALATSDLFIMYAYMWLKEWNFPNLLSIYSYYKYYWKETVKNQLQHFVYSINNEVRTSSDSPFVNVSIYDKPRLRQLVKNKYMALFNINTDEEIEYIVDFISYLQYLYLEVMNKEGVKLTFPVTTINISIDDKGEILDKSFFKKIVKYNSEYARFNIYVSDINSFKTAMCCVSRDAEVIVKHKGKIEKVKIGEFIDNTKDFSELSVFYRNNWYPAKPVKLEYNRDWYRIVLSNGEELVTTNDHIHLTLRGEKTTRELTTNDFLLFVKKEILPYDLKNLISFRNTGNFIYDNSGIYFRIGKIEKVNINEKFAYCFEIIDDKVQYFTLANGVITHNCRLNFKDDMIQERASDVGLVKGIDSFGNGLMSIGSLRVVTLNLPRIALMAKNEQKSFWQVYNEKLELARKVLLAQRQLVKEGIKKGLYITFKYGFLKEENMFSTFGLIGFYECAKLLEYNNLDEYVDFVEDLLQKTENKLNQFVAEDKVFYNLEQIPGESSANTLALADNLLYDYKPDELMLYSNQFVPLWEGVDIFTKIDIDGRLVKQLSGGAISFINVLSKLTPEQMESLISYAIQKGLEHFAINYYMAVCKNGHVNFGKTKTCSVCGCVIEDYVTRVVGYLTRVSSWSKARQKEFEKRIFY